MTCQDARDLFSPLVDGALPPPEEAGLRAHVAGCADCARELASFERLVGLMRAVEPARAPAGFVDRVVAAARTTPWYRRLLRGLFVPFPAKLPLEAAAIVLLGVMVVTVYRQTPELQQAAREGSPSLATSRDPDATRAETPTTSAESRSSGDAPAQVSEPRAPSAAPATETREAGPRRPDEAGRQATPPESDASRVLSTTFQKALKDQSAKESPAASGALPGAAPPPSSPAPSGAVTTPGAPTTPGAAPTPATTPGAATTPGGATAPGTAAPSGGTAGASRGALSATREMAEARREAQATTPTTPPGPARDAAQPEVAKRAAPESRSSAPSSVRSAAQSAAERSRAAPDVVGRLSVTDRAGARRAVSEMASKLGGTEVVRSAGADESPVVEILIPRRAWEDLVRELSRLGRFTIESRPAELPPDVQVAIRLD